MAMMMDQQQQSHKHHCRICKKGFGCGRALGGHMRAHGINDDPVGEQGDGADDDPASACGSEWDDKLQISPSAGGTTRRMYSLRTNPHRLRTCRACENCGKEFSSWKAFLEHGRCASAGEVDPGDESMVSSPRSDGAEDEVDPGERRGCMGWSKGKRSRRTSKAPAGGGAASGSYCLSSQEEDLANCLVMLSAGRVETTPAVETEESCASASKDEDRRRPVERAAAALPTVEKPKPTAAAAPPRGMFECKACKKVFSSHQALGGHRASHKKVKGCFAARLEDLDEGPADEEVITTRDHATAIGSSSGMAAEDAAPLAIVPFDQVGGGGAPLKKKSKLHECSICHRVFTSGQALGGHKRCHWITSNAGGPDPASMAKLHQMQHAQAAQHQQLLQLRPMLDKSEPALDLNLPAPADNAAGSRPDRLEAPPLSLDVPAALFLQHAWADNNKHHNTRNNKNNSNNNNMNTNSNTNYNNNSNKNTTCNLDDVDDEADSKIIKLAKLSDLKDLNMGGDSSSWLQVGIGSSTKTGREP